MDLVKHSLPMRPFQGSMAPVSRFSGGYGPSAPPVATPVLKHFKEMFVCVKFERMFSTHSFPALKFPALAKFPVPKVFGSSTINMVIHYLGSPEKNKN